LLPRERKTGLVLLDRREEQLTDGISPAVPTKCDIENGWPSQSGFQVSHCAYR
jgi:hypothetical protein